MAARGYASKASLPPHDVIHMPALSPTMTQGNVGAWHKAVGDSIEPGELLVEIETDKAQMDFEFQEDGVLAKTLIEPGTKDVAVGTPICIMVQDKADIEAFKDYVPDAQKPESEPEETITEEDMAAPKEASPKSEASSSSSSTSSESSTSSPSSSSPTPGHIAATPSAKRVARERKIDLAEVKGTGPNGRIVEADVVNFKPKSSAPAKASSSPAKSAKSAAPAPAPAAGASYTDIPLSNVRKVIAQRLSESKQNVPHYYLTVELDASQVTALRTTLNAEARGRYKLSLNDFVIKAAGLALRDVPQVNAQWNETSIREFKNVDIAVAVATDNGLITPIVTESDKKGLSAISNGVREMAGRARQNKLQPHEYQGGTFTISNLGMFGIQHFTAIVNPPHAGILAVGGLEDKLVLDETAERGFSSRQVMKVTLSADHRIVDGAVGAKWLQAFKEYFENPLNMML
ncbi:hypothetical protein CXG81DRAFT_10081 [Caulochytrium protostelioides]|uniref:Acetyltransferase component of pyruvate dehydrogenase complex n=1 Tax=Caulochytrium protostelioides TaxID=1555241 RepID=A0A4P9XC74_9FUNG|nr:pyruvate dehydrogenase [Caulochytrium protostelioides]RKP03016.1 hypothetical protein CXG81DRAFT_10081 [Caulochytrium protostelioides]|eukprot:RKP03016.1 hypothetical protein CXG81DRAFT_10081 [Caulochytrium protostelioides]